MSNTEIRRLASALTISLLIVSIAAVVYSTPVLAQTTVRFIASGDSRGNDNGVNATILNEIAEATIDEGVDFILFPGDLVTGSADSATLESQLMTWRSIMQPVYDAGIGVYPCRGNHDIGNLGAWNHVFSGDYALPENGPIGEKNITFSFTIGNAFIVGLDQYVTLHRINQTWLNDQFALNTQPHVFCFCHEPAFSVRHNDCLDDYPSERNAFWNSMAAEGGRIYFAGHDHFYNHARIDDGDGDLSNDLHQYVVGTAGAPLRTWDGLYNGNNGSWTPILQYHEAEYGYLLVEITDLEVTTTWKHRTAPGVYEVVNYSCGDVNSSGAIDIDDVVYLISYIFQGGPVPEPYGSGDTDCSGTIDIDDAVYVIGYIFSGGNPPCDTDGDGAPDC